MEKSKIGWLAGGGGICDCDEDDDVPFLYSVNCCCCWAADDDDFNGDDDDGGWYSSLLVSLFINLACMLSYCYTGSVKRIEHAIEYNKYT